MTNPPTTRDGAAVRLPPPVLFLCSTLLGGAAQVALGVGALPLARNTAFGLAALFTLSGATLLLWASGLFKRSGQDPRPWRSTPALIISGVYRYTRNPMYVAMAMAQAAFGFGFRSLWILLLLPASIVLVYVTAIRHEERYLEDKFGNEYVAYKQKVRRWL